MAASAHSTRWKATALLPYLAIGLAAACSVLPSASSGESEMTGQCRGEMSKIEPEAADSDIEQVRVASELSPGGREPFSWVNPADPSVGFDDFIVQCWTRDGWRSAWIELDAAALEGGPEVLLRTWSSNPAIQLPTDMHPETAGTLLIPSAAPSGFYRFQLIRSSAVGATDWVTAEARFSVSR